MLSGEKFQVLNYDRCGRIYLPPPKELAQDACTLINALTPWVERTSLPVPLEKIIESLEQVVVWKNEPVRVSDYSCTHSDDEEQIQRRFRYFDKKRGMVVFVEGRVIKEHTGEVRKHRGTQQPDVSLTDEIYIIVTNEDRVTETSWSSFQIFTSLPFSIIEELRNGTYNPMLRTKTNRPGTIIISCDKSSPLFIQTEVTIRLP